MADLRKLYNEEMRSSLGIQVVYTEYTNALGTSNKGNVIFV